MESNNWIVENLNNAIGTWNEKLSEIWRLLTASPQNFKDGSIWTVMVNINDARKAIGYPNAKPIFHSNRGFQYTNKVFHQKLVDAGMIQSMSRVGRCFDTPCEYYFAIAA